MTLAWPAGTVFLFWRDLASAVGSGDSAPAASACRWRTGDSVAWPSTPATAAPARGTPHCNNAPAAAVAGTSAYSPSKNISGAEDDAWAPKLLGVDFPEKLKDLRVGPWEGDTPRSSSLEGEPIPLRDALFAQGESGNTRYITPNSDRIKTKAWVKTEPKHSSDDRLLLGPGRISSTM